jgi:hypothetical protein
MPRSLLPVKSGDPITTSWANEILGELRRLRRIVGAPPIEVRENEAGIQIGLAGLPVFVYARLDADLAAGDVAGRAGVLRFDAAGSEKWSDSTRDITGVAEPQEGAYLEGERHLCFFHPDAGRFIPIPGVQWHLGKPDADIATGASGTVSLWEVGTSGEADSGLDVTAHNWLLPKAQQNERVIVVQHLQSRRWYLAAVLPKARWIRFALSAALSATEASKSASVQHYWQGDDPGANVTVYNLPTHAAGTYVFHGDAGDIGYAAWDERDGKYWIVQMECP